MFIHTDNIRKLLSETASKITIKNQKNLYRCAGTNGKLSIANFYYQILRLNNKKAASIGTLGVKSNNFNLDLSNTTTDPIYLGKILENLKVKK